MKLTKMIFNKSLLILTTILIFISSCGFVYAHSPTNMNLSYNITTKELQVSINHQVSNPNTHYIYNIVIKKNGVTIINQDYSNQPGSSFTYIYNETSAVEGETIEVTGYCNQGGSIKRQLTVSSKEISETDNDNSTPGFQLILFIFSIIFLIIVFKKKY